MPLALQWLVFDASESDDGGCSLEAMASVPPQRLPEVLAEVAQVLNWARRLAPGGPQPLDDGGDWDTLLQIQADVSPLQDVAWTPGSTPFSLPPLPADTRWVAVVLTLGLSAALAPVISEHLIP